MKELRALTWYSTGACSAWLGIGLWNHAADTLVLSGFALCICVPLALFLEADS